MHEWRSQGNFVDISFLPPCGDREGTQAWWQVPPTEPARQSSVFCLALCILERATRMPLLFKALSGDSVAITGACNTNRHHGKQPFWWGWRSLQQSYPSLSWLPFSPFSLVSYWAGKLRLTEYTAQSLPTALPITSVQPHSRDTWLHSNKNPARQTQPLFLEMRKIM